MRRKVRLLPELAMATICAVAGCTASTELLPPAVDAAVVDAVAVDAATVDVGPVRRQFAFCPINIDVYGGANTVLVGCGGPSQLPLSIVDGYFAPGVIDYEASMAGLLRTRLAHDPDLTSRFGSTWNVRSCGTALETLPQMVPPLSADQCGAETPAMMGFLAPMCTNTPAPIVLLPADAMDDLCHGGGGSGSLKPDDESTYAEHLATRLDLFLAARMPQIAVVGPKTEWQSPVSSLVYPPDRASCLWNRPSWNITGVNAWRQRQTFSFETKVVSDLHDLFKSHHPCCVELGVTCDSNWFTGGGATLSCAGGAVLVEHWYSALKDVLLSHDFECP